MIEQNLLVSDKKDHHSHEEDIISKHTSHHEEQPEKLLKNPNYEKHQLKKQKKNSDSGSNLEFISAPDKEISEINRPMPEVIVASNATKELEMRYSEKHGREMLFDENSDKDPSVNTLEIIQEQIKEAEVKRDEMEAQLEKVRDSIEGFNSLESFSEEHRKPNLQDNNEPIKKHEENKKKSQLNGKKLKMLREEQIKREEVLAKEIEKINKKIEKQKNQLAFEQEKLKNIKNEEYKAELAKMHEKNLARKRELSEIKKRQRNLEVIKNSKPLYVQIEEKYRKEVQFPELQERKMELHKKNLDFAPLSSVDLQEHAKRYDEIKKEHKQQSEKEFKERILTDKIRSSSYGKSSWTHRVLDQDKKLKSELNRASQERLEKIEKQTRYADLVKELFMPTFDRLKRQESDPYIKNKERVKSNRSSGREDKRIVPSDTEAKKEQAKRPKKFKENPLVPKPPPKKEIKVVDFLEERRKIRQEEGGNHQEVDLDWQKELEKDVPDHEKARMLKKKAKMIEREARKQELLIGVVNPTSPKTLQQTENVNDLLLNSIKAKLAILDHKNN